MPIEETVQSGPKLAVTEVGSPGEGHFHFVWGHGWGQSGTALAALAETLKPFGSSSLLDFPGFGKSPSPPDSWGTVEYADCVARWMSGLRQPVIWIGHSFGGRVGIQLAARHPRLVAGMVLIAAAGLQRRRSFVESLRFQLRKTMFKTARSFVREGTQLDALRRRFGSTDYVSAGALRPIFVRVVGEDLAGVARKVQCPTLLIYGTADTETPPEMGHRYKALIPQAEMVELAGFTHLSVLGEGRHQVALKIRHFLESLK